MKSLYVVGGRQRYARTLFERGYWYCYDKAVILRVDPELGEISVCNQYVSPADACAPTDPEILYKSGTVAHERMYVCTQTEILIYALPDFQQVGYISLPSFNDVHHVRPTPDGNLLVANSGLEMVMEITQTGQVVREWNVLGEEPWDRFSPTIDYRKGINLKPHRSHPNHVFYIDDQIWTTRFHQKDAICLTHPHRRIEIGIERVHDGLYHDGMLYFTTVNGRIVVVNASTLKWEEVIDLNQMHEQNTLQGWCRSIYIDDGRVWVGYSTIRPTKSRENIAWIARGLRSVRRTHIACYDIVGRRLLDDIELADHGLSAVFSILPCEHARQSQHELISRPDASSAFDRLQVTHC